LIDSISILRDTYSDSKRYRIIVYALLPELYPNPSWDTGNYHANGFAALLELNALSVGRFSPDDLLGVKNGWVKINRTSGLGAWGAYGVVNDGSAPGQRTGDGAYIPSSF